MASLEYLASQSLPLFLPRLNDHIAIGSGFNSKFVTSNRSPWVSGCAYMIDDAKCAVEIDGGISSYREGNSNSSVQHSEHLSASLGVTVGCSLLNANVTGSYDQSLSDRVAGTRVSKNSSFRIGRVFFKTDPRLTPEAREALRRSENEFREMFGDYYVAGFQIGADAGGCLTIAHSDQSKEKKMQIQATAKVLWVKKTITTAETSKELSSNHSMSFCSYDTLLQHNKKIVGTNLEEIHRAAIECMKQIDNMQSAVTRAVLKLGLDTDADVSAEDCARLYNSGLVVQLILVPYCKLTEYVVLTSSCS